MVFEIYLKINYDSPYSQLSKTLESLKFYTFCNNHNDVLMVDGEIDEKSIIDIKKVLGIESKIPYSLDTKNLVNYLIIDCICINNFSRLSGLIQKFHGIEVSPVFHEDGWEYHKFICINKQIISDILEKLEEFFEYEILYIHEDDFSGPLKSYGISAEQLKNNLTKGQRRILSEAFELGYYQIPRKIKLESLAEKHKKTRYAVESQLRRGENEIMKLIAPIVSIESIEENKKTK